MLKKFLAVAALGAMALVSGASARAADPAPFADFYGGLFSIAGDKLSYTSGQVDFWFDVTTNGLYGIGKNNSVTATVTAFGDVNKVSVPGMGDFYNVTNLDLKFYDPIKKLTLLEVKGNTRFNSLDDTLLLSSDTPTNFNSSVLTFTGDVQKYYAGLALNTSAPESHGSFSANAAPVPEPAFMQLGSLLLCGGGLGLLRFRKRA